MMADGNTGNGNVYENHNNNDDGSNDTMVKYMTMM